MTNDEIMHALLDHARQLDREGGAVFQVRAFRAAALVVQGLPRPASDLLAEGGRKALEAVPGIGRSIAYAIETLLEGGLRALRPVHVPAREQLRAFRGVGHRAAELLQQEGIDSVAELPTDRLAAMRRRIESIHGEEPSTEDLLAADDDFRRLAGAGVLGRAAPRAYIPGGPKWEGVYRCQRGGWDLTLSFADTALAHRMGKTRDWVTARFRRGDATGERTIVTETRGALAGRRVVRGREEEGQAA